MSLKSIRLCALLFSMAPVSAAAAGIDAGSTALADKLIDALQHHRYGNAAAMFATGGPDVAGIERSLQQIDDRIGGFATMHAVASVPEGKSLRFEIFARHDATPKAVHSWQLRYVGTATDGKPVFYQLDLKADGQPPRVLCFALHLPASDAPSASRATQLMASLKR